MIFSRGHTVALPALSLAVVLAGVLVLRESPSRSAADAATTGRIDEPAFSRAPNEGPAGSSAGSVSFVVAGEDKRFEYLPESGCVYTRLASTIRAHSAAGSTESLSIQFMSMDLKQQTFPAVLPLPKDLTKPMNPMTAGATVGFSYTDTDGVEWAGPGKVHVDSFDSNGVIPGTFDQVVLPHTHEERPNITLTDGSFSARITNPW